MRFARIPRFAVAAIAAACLYAAPAHAQIVAADEASDPGYATPGNWTNGSNGGTGFLAWVLNPATNGNSGFFYFDSNNNGSTTGPGINSANSRSWGAYANSGNNAIATRPFVTPLVVGQTFGASMDNGFIDNGSSVGVAVADATGTRRLSFDFLGGAANYRLTDASGTIDTGLGFTDGGLRTAMDLTGPNSYQFTVTRLSDGATYQHAGTLVAGGSIDRFIAFNNNAGFNSSNDAYFNKLIIAPVPEPTMVLIICGAAGGLFAAGRRIMKPAAAA